MAAENGNTKLNIGVPVDWWPSMVTTLHGGAMADGTGAAVLRAGVEALGGISQTYSATLDARKAALDAAPVRNVVADSVDAATKALLNSARSQVDHGRERALAQGMDVAFNKLVPKVEKSLKQMRAAREQIAVDLRRAVTGTSEGRYADQIRSHFSRKSIKDAVAIIRDGAESDARATAAALCRDVPSYLQPFGPKEMELLHQVAATRFAPKAAAQLKAADDIIGRVERARESFVEKFAKLKPRITKSTGADDAIARLANAS